MKRGKEEEKLLWTKIMRGKDRFLCTLRRWFVGVFCVVDIKANKKLFEGTKKGKRT